MDTREDVSRLTKPLAHRLSAMIEARLLTFREFIPWADALIMRLDQPPVWLLNLSMTKYYPDASGHAREFAHSEPFDESLTLQIWVGDFVASQYLRYERREISWATFLELAGREADNNGGRHSCEYFYSLLNDYEEEGFGFGAENCQRAQIVSEYEMLIRSVRNVFESIASFRARRSSVQ